MSLNVCLCLCCCSVRCEGAISYGRTINRHIAEPQKRGEVEFLSFAQGSLVQVFAKDIGKDGLYWEAEVCQILFCVRRDSVCGCGVRWCRVCVG